MISKERKEAILMKAQELNGAFHLLLHLHHPCTLLKEVSQEHFKSL